MSDKRKLAYVFRGAPASGKGTITKLFMPQITGKIAYLELDALRWGFHLINRGVSEVTEDEHHLSYQNFLAILENYCRSGVYTLVIEGLFSWDIPSPHGNIQDILSILEHYKYESHLFFLKADYQTLWERNLKREYSVPEEEFKKLYEHVTKKIGKKEIVIDVGKKNINETLKTLEDNIYKSF